MRNTGFVFLIQSKGLKKMSDKTNPSDLYDEEFLKKKEEFFSKTEDISSAASEIEEDDGSFEKLIDDEINTYTILYYRPKDTGTVSEGILVNEATRTFVIYYFGAAR